MLRALIENIRQRAKTDNVGREMEILRKNQKEMLALYTL